jgi:hypothetical protein
MSQNENRLTGSRLKSITVFSLLLVVVLTFLWVYFLKHKFYNNSDSKPIGGWDTVKIEIESKFGQNENIKKAALQLGEAFQEAIDYPQDAVMNDPKFGKALGCFLLVTKKYQNQLDLSKSSMEEIRSIVVSSSEKQKRYIS